MFQGDEELTTDQLRNIFDGLDTHRTYLYHYIIILTTNR